MSATGGTAARAARRASSGNWPERLARLGLAARGVLYLVIAVLTLQVAFSGRDEQTDQEGALQAVVSQPFGRFIVWVLAIGLIGYVLWRLAAAAFGPRADPAADDAKGRGKALIECVLYGLVALTALRIAMGSGSGGGGEGSQTLTAQVLAWPAGQLIVGAAGMAIIAGGAYLAWEGWQTDFTDELQLGRLSPGARKAVIELGRVGRIARGFVFMLIGLFVVLAAVNYDPSQVRGLDGALASLAAQPYGRWLLVLVALGLAAYGAYCLVESRLRRITM
jgi:Domain of Unknown Function (DUF1206)